MTDSNNFFYFKLNIALFDHGHDFVSCETMKHIIHIVDCSFLKVRLIAVDSNGIPVTEPTILQAAAEQAGIVFLVKNNKGINQQITIDSAMKVKIIKTTF